LGQQRQPFDRLRAGLLNDGVRTYTYDHANRLTQVANGTLATEFTYNGAGDRVAKTVDGVTTDYVLDGSTGLTTGPAAGLTQVLQGTTAGQTTSYLYGHDGSTGLTTGLLAQHDSGTWAYHVNDGLGSVRQLVNPQGQVDHGRQALLNGSPMT
jgi:YD repeat-containing protein